MTEQLKPLPCPFCGGTDIRAHVYGGGEPDAFMQCHDCSADGPNGLNRAGAIEAWNRRAQPAQAGQVLTDDRLLAMWEGTDGERALRPTLGKNKILSFARAVEQAVLAKRVPQWLPIETAPKDGTEILLHAPACEYEGANVKARTTYGHWSAPSDTPIIKYQDGFAPEPEWEEFEPFWASWDGGFTEEHPPTHWMPLPPPPGIVGEKGGA